MAKLLFPEYVSLPEVKSAIDRSELKGDIDEWLTVLTNSVFLAAQAMMGRQLTERAYNHDGTDLPHLDTFGGREFFLANPPVRAIRTLKLAPDETALTRGWDEEYQLDELTGRIRLRPGLHFYDLAEILEVDYDGGFTPTPPAGKEYRFGWTEAAADIKQSIINQVADFAQRRARGRERVTSFSSDAGTFTISDAELLADVKATWMRHRVVSL